jgi:hypothetical protein
MIKLTLILFATIFSDSTDNLEQKASDYFFDNFFQQDYAAYKVIEFKNLTDTSKYYGIIHKCENWDKETKYQIMSTKPSESVDIKAKTKDIKVKEIKKNSGRLKIYVYSSVKVGDNYFVSIATYKKLHFANYYFIKFNKDGNVIDTCRTGEII